MKSFQFFPNMLGLARRLIWSPISPFSLPPAPQLCPNEDFINFLNTNQLGIIKMHQKWREKAFSVAALVLDNGNRMQWMQ